MLKLTVAGQARTVADGARFAALFDDPRVVAARVDGKLAGLGEPAADGQTVEPVVFDSEAGREVFWHSTSHLMAQAVKDLFPGVKLAIGPAVDDGFYYDFDAPAPFTDDDLRRIEARMAELVAADLPIERVMWDKPALAAYFSERQETYKLELLAEIPEDRVSTFGQGEFLDLCLGPHLDRTGRIGAFKLLSVAGAYWRADERNRMLSRVYGVSFPTRAELDAHLKRLEEARARDHRKLGPALELFNLFEEAGAGLLFWAPKGGILRRVIEDYWASEHRRRGYELVTTPHIARARLWEISGHAAYYRENMYFLKVENEEYVLKPMNCPGHMLIYRSRLRSYRDLPLRLAEIGTVYRNERSGVLMGALRVRGFAIDDGHIFCTREQVADEVRGVVQLAIDMFKAFGFNEYQVELSAWDPAKRDQYMGSDEDWDMAERVLVEVLAAMNLPYVRRPNEAAFYGPKIDIKIMDALGRPTQATTCQFDFNLPERFHLQYMGADGQHHPVYLVHRAILGSLERFLALLIEHYGGAFPLWLAPDQVAVLTITDAEQDYARQVVERLTREGVRTIVDLRNEKISYKIAEMERRKVPYMAVVGAREKEQGRVALRKRRGGGQAVLGLDELVGRLKEEIALRQ